MSTPKSLTTVMACTASPAEVAARDFDDRASPALAGEVEAVDVDVTVVDVLDVVESVVGVTGLDGLPGVDELELELLPHACKTARRAGLASAAVRNVRRSMPV